MALKQGFLENLLKRKGKRNIGRKENMEQHNFGGSFAGRFNPSDQDPAKEKLTKLKQ